MDRIKCYSMASSTPMSSAVATGPDNVTFTLPKPRSASPAKNTNVDGMSSIITIYRHTGSKLVNINACAYDKEKDFNYCMNGGGNMGNVNIDSFLNVIENNVCEQMLDCYNSYVGSCQDPSSFVIPEKERDFVVVFQWPYIIYTKENFLLWLLGSWGRECM